MALSDYQLIEYIQGVDGAYIDTNFKPTRYSVVSGLYRIDTGATRYLYGVNDGSNHNYSFRYDNSNANYSWRHGNTSVSTQTLSPVFSSDTDILCEAERTSSPARITLTVSDYPDATSSLSKYFTTPTAAQTSTKNLFIMARNNNGSAGNYAIDCRLYWIDIRSSSALPSNPIFYGVPIREKTADPDIGYLRVGLYDTVSDSAFWPILRNSNFIAGPDIIDNAVHINVGGTWKTGTPYVNVNGTWKAGKIYINVNGTWKEGT